MVETVKTTHFPFTESAWNRVLAAIWWALCLFALVDTVNGVIVRSGLGVVRPAQVLKTGVLVTMWCWTARYAPRRALWSLGVLVILLQVGFWQTVAFGGANWSGTLPVLLKAVLPVVAFVFVRTVLEREDPVCIGRWLDRIVAFNLAVLLANIVLGFFGVGFKQYHGAVGGTGFLYAGNEVSGMLLLLSAIGLQRLYARHPGFYLPALVILLVVGVLKATKVSMLGIALTGCVIPLIYELPRLRRPRPALVGALVGGVALIAVAVLVLPSVFEAAGYLDRWRYWWVAHGGDPVRFLLSSRDLYLARAIDMIRVDGTWVHGLVGWGVGGYTEAMARFSVKTNWPEMDLVDVFLIFGGIGWFALWAVHLGAVAAGVRRLMTAPSAARAVMLWTAVLVLGIGAIAGHVLMSGMCGIFLGLVLALGVSRSRLDPIDS